MKKASKVACVKLKFKFEKEVWYQLVMWVFS